MFGMDISDSCKKVIETMEMCFSNIKKSQESLKEENLLLNQRVKTAEDSILQFKENVQQELERTYKEGYQAGLKDSTQGNVEGGTKLVYTKN